MVEKGWSHTLSLPFSLLLSSSFFLHAYKFHSRRGPLKIARHGHPWLQQYYPLSLGSAQASKLARQLTCTSFLQFSPLWHRERPPSGKFQLPPNIGYNSLFHTNVVQHRYTRTSFCMRKYFCLNIILVYIYYVHGHQYRTTIFPISQELMINMLLCVKIKLWCGQLGGYTCMSKVWSFTRVGRKRPSSPEKLARMRYHQPYALSFHFCSTLIFP